MDRIVDWTIPHIDTHQTGKHKRINDIVRVLERKRRVDYKRFLAEIQFIGVRKKVAEEYLEALIDLGVIKRDKDDIVWIWNEKQETRT